MVCIFLPGSIGNAENVKWNCYGILCGTKVFFRMLFFFQKTTIALVADKDGRYERVRVNPFLLSEAQKKAEEKDKAESYILMLNLLLDLVFTKEELQCAKGGKDLEHLKMEAVRGNDLVFVFFKQKKK